MNNEGNMHQREDKMIWPIKRYEQGKSVDETVTEKARRREARQSAWLECETGKEVDRVKVAYTCDYILRKKARKFIKKIESMIAYYKDTGNEDDFFEGEVGQMIMRQTIQRNYGCRNVYFEKVKNKAERRRVEYEESEKARHEEIVLQYRSTFPDCYYQHYLKDDEWKMVFQPTEHQKEKCNGQLIREVERKRNRGEGDMDDEIESDIEKGLLVVE